MATVLDIVNRALHLIGAKDPAESATAQEAADGLVSLNDMLDSWFTDRLFVYRLAQTSYSWPVGQTSQTIGIGGNINVARPVRVEDSYLISGQVSYPLATLTKQGYDAIQLKGLSVNFPQWVYYDPTYPLGTVYLYPVPASTLDLRLNYWLQLTQFSAVTDVVDFPPGYKRAITYNLAVEIAGEYGMQVPPVVAAIAQRAAGNIKRLNSQPQLATIEAAYSPASWNFSIYRGW